VFLKHPKDIDNSHINFNHGRQNEANNRYKHLDSSGRGHGDEINMGLYDQGSWGS